MRMLSSLLAAAVAAGVGVVVWVLIRNFTGYELGLVAWGIGVLAGLGAAVASAGKADGATGFLAGCVAVLAIAGAKYAFAGMVYSEVMDSLGDDVMVVYYADAIVEEREANGDRLVWPAGYTIETAEEREHYPEGIWDQAAMEWNSVAGDEQTRIKQAVALDGVNYALRLEGEEPIDSFTTGAILKADLSPFDVIWVVLAFASAFKIGSGAVGES
ncbi:MAG: hypothetical protein ACF8MJ_02550 [Phycisphaerales bacterium JB050]